MRHLKIKFFSYILALTILTIGVILTIGLVVGETNNSIFALMRLPAIWGIYAGLFFIFQVLILLIESKKVGTLLSKIVILFFLSSFLLALLPMAQAWVLQSLYILPSPSTEPSIILSIIFITLIQIVMILLFAFLIKFIFSAETKNSQDEFIKRKFFFLTLFNYGVELPNEDYLIISKKRRGQKYEAIVKYINSDDKIESITFSPMDETSITGEGKQNITKDLFVEDLLKFSKKKNINKIIVIYELEEPPLVYGEVPKETKLYTFKNFNNEIGEELLYEYYYKNE